MQDSKLRSRWKAQLTKFSSERCEGLSRPLEKFVGQMLFGIQASQDVKRSHIARSLKEEIPLIKTEDRLSRNLRMGAAIERNGWNPCWTGTSAWSSAPPGSASSSTERM